MSAMTHTQTPQSAGSPSAAGNSSHGAALVEVATEKRCWRTTVAPRSAVQDDIFSMLAAIDADPSAALVPSRRDDRAAVRAAVTRAASEHQGLVHISWVRPFIPAGTSPHVVGAVFAGLHLSGHLVATTRTLPNGGPSGNAAKPAKVSRLVRPID